MCYGPGAVFRARKPSATETKLGLPPSLRAKEGQREQNEEMIYFPMVINAVKRKKPGGLSELGEGGTPGRPLQVGAPGRSCEDHGITFGGDHSLGTAVPG